MNELVEFLRQLSDQHKQLAAYKLKKPVRNSRLNMGDVIISSHSRNYLDVESRIKHSITCVVCKSELKSPHILSCGHNICLSHCKETVVFCVKCDRNVTIDVLVENRELETLIQVYF